MTELRKIKTTVFCFDNGNVAVTGPDGRQIPDAQDAWILAVARNLERAGYDPLEATVNLPGGWRARFFRLDDGSLSWRLGD